MPDLRFLHLLRSKRRTEKRVVAPAQGRCGREKASGKEEEHMEYNGIKREIMALPLALTLRISKERNFKRMEFMGTGLKYEIDEFLEEAKEELAEPLDEALYVLFDDAIVKVSDAWSEEAEIIRVMR